MKIKKLITLLLLLGFSSSLVACNTNEESSSNLQSQPISEEISSNNSSDVNIENGEYAYEGTLTIAPYKVYNEDGSEDSTHEYMFDAIRTAGSKSTSSNKMYVKDGNDLQIFKRQLHIKPSKNKLRIIIC